VGGAHRSKIEALRHTTPDPSQTPGPASCLVLLRLSLCAVITALSASVRNENEERLKASAEGHSEVACGMWHAADFAWEMG
jgi:hypothetical protein